MPGNNSFVWPRTEASYKKKQSEMFLTMSLGEIIEYGSNLPVSKLFSMVDQSLFDCPVSCQHHHLLQSKVDCENWSIFSGQLQKWRQGKVRLYLTDILK